MGIIESGIEAVKVLVPPKTNDLDEQQRWRWVVFIAIIALSAGFVGHIALECGYIPSVYSGFASVNDTQAIQRRLDIITTISLEHEIRSKTLELCKETNQDHRNELNDDLARLQREYWAIEKHYYPLPACTQL